MQENGLYFHVPQSLDDWPHFVLSNIEQFYWHAFAGCNDSSGCGGSGGCSGMMWVHKAMRIKEATSQFRTATKLSDSWTDSCSMLLGFSVLRRTALRTPRRVKALQAQTALGQHCGLTVGCSMLFLIARQLVGIWCHTPNAHSLTDEDPKPG